MYDKGLHGLDNSPVSDAESASYSRFYRQANRKTPTVGGRTHAYNFDEWHKAHYQQNLQRKQQEKRRYEEYVAGKSRETESKRNDDLGFLKGFLFLLSILVGMYILDARVERDRRR